MSSNTRSEIRCPRYFLDQSPVSWQNTNEWGILPFGNFPGSETPNNSVDKPRHYATVRIQRSDAVAQRTRHWATNSNLPDCGVVGQRFCFRNVGNTSTHSVGRPVVQGIASSSL